MSFFPCNNPNLKHFECISNFIIIGIILATLFLALIFYCIFRRNTWHWKDIIQKSVFYCTSPNNMLYKSILFILLCFGSVYLRPIEYITMVYMLNICDQSNNISSLCPRNWGYGLIDSFIGSLSIFAILFMLYFHNAKFTMLKITKKHALSENQWQRVLTTVFKQTLMFASIFFGLRLTANLLAELYIPQLMIPTIAPNFVPTLIFRFILSYCLLYISWSRSSFVDYLEELTKFHAIEAKDEGLFGLLEGHLNSNFPKLRNCLIQLQANNRNFGSIDDMMNNLKNIIEANIRSSESSVSEIFETHKLNRHSLIIAPVEVPEANLLSSTIWIYLNAGDIVAYTISVPLLWIFNDKQEYIEWPLMIVYFIQITVKAYFAYLVLSNKKNSGIEVHNK